MAKLFARAATALTQIRRDQTLDAETPHSTASAIEPTVTNLLTGYS
jgi:hypothetical protein